MLTVTGTSGNSLAATLVTTYTKGLGVFCTGDSQMANPDGDGTSKVVTEIRVYNPAGSVSQPLSGGLACPPLVLPGWDMTTKLREVLDATNPAYDPLLAQTFRRWDTLCTLSAPQVGDYVVAPIARGKVALGEIASPLRERRRTADRRLESGVGVTGRGGGIGTLPR